MAWKTCGVCQAHERTIQVLQDEVDWLRLQLGTPLLTRRSDVLKNGGSVPPLRVETSPWVGDEEEDIQHMLKHGLISPTAAQAALEQIGALNTTIAVE